MGDRPINIETSDRDLKTLCFIENGKEILSGGRDGMLRRWRADNGRQVGEPVQQVGGTIWVVALSPDRRWLVCGVQEQPHIRVLDAKTFKKVLDIHDQVRGVWTIGISPDSTKFATGASDGCTFVFNLTTGKQFFKLQLDGFVWAARFSPNGDRIATATSGKMIHIHNSDDGKKLRDIPCPFKENVSSPLAWSADGRHLFALTFNEAKCFDASSGSLLSTWSVPGDDGPQSSSSIALSYNKKFIIIASKNSLSFWDATTQKQVGTAIDVSANSVSSIALTPDDSYIAFGEENGKFTVQKLRGILPDSYLPGSTPLSDQLDSAITNAVFGFFKKCPIILIDVQSGRLCDRDQRNEIFRSEPQFRELVSSMRQNVDEERIRRVVEKYFQYVMFSHVWIKNPELGKEPSYPDLKSVGSVWNLASSQPNDKLRKFCELVRDNGYRWAWSDTCCIDKTWSTQFYESLKLMYRWYKECTTTYVYLPDVDSSSAVRDLTHSIWMTRAWTEQELLAPDVIHFYDHNWKSYRGDTRTNHKESPKIMEELAKAIGVPSETIRAFNPDDLSVREKLRLASTRQATVEEDVAYSLIGIFKSDILPYYGEGDAALGHLFEEIVTRSSELTVLAWVGKCSSYNSCLPAGLSVYSQTPYVSPVIKGAELDRRVAALKNSLSQEDAKLIHDPITQFPPPQFMDRRLHLPSIIFPVKGLVLRSRSRENLYRAHVSGIGDVDFHTPESLELTEPGRFIFVHPWRNDLLDPASQGWDESEGNSTSQWLRDYNRALRFVARLQQPFQALLLRQQPSRDCKRIATEHEIIVQGLSPQINFVKDFHFAIVTIV